MNWLRKLFSGNASGRVNFRNPLVIDSPRIAFLNLVGPQAESTVTADKHAFGGFFELVEANADNVADCDVLLIYCDLAPDGTVGEESRTLRDMIDSSSAKIAIVASENSGESYMAAGKRDGYRPVNLVMTLDRKGEGFAQFFGSLFRRMFSGESMLSAWVELAPQHSGAKHDDECPETIFLAEVSHIIFRGETEIS
jgi:hypothetical protein